MQAAPTACCKWLGRVLFSAPMAPHFLPLLALLALLAAPFGMAGGAAAMPFAPSEAAMGHCEEMAPAGGHHEPEQERGIDCTIACAALPAIAPVSSAAFQIAAPMLAPLPLSSLVGTFPEADPPPPRFA